MSTTPPTFDTPEHRRLQEAHTGDVLWKAWGPYLSERQWGTVREDYSANGDAWGYFTHDQARSRAYRWGEDGIAGICDERQRLCLALEVPQLPRDPRFADNPIVFKKLRRFSRIFSAESSSKPARLSESLGKSDTPPSRVENAFTNPAFSRGLQTRTFTPSRSRQ